MAASHYAKYLRTEKFIFSWVVQDLTVWELLNTSLLCRVRLYQKPVQSMRGTWNMERALCCVTVNKFLHLQRHLKYKTKTNLLLYFRIWLGNHIFFIVFWKYKSTYYRKYENIENHREKSKLHISTQVFFLRGTKGQPGRHSKLKDT